MFSVLLGLEFVGLLIYSVEDGLGHFRLPALRDEQREVLIKLLILFRQLRET